MRAAVIVVAAALLALASARCPNSCSGHGDCGAYDTCSCWANWQGYDCSDRTCEFNVAWATDHRQNAHYYSECSGKGICDRTTGACACFDGYSGSSCQRSVCPNDCSGHGKCRLVSELSQATQTLASIGSANYQGNTHLLSQQPAGTAFPYTRWDGDHIQACVCDGGFFGPDCSQRSCPKGNDPLSTCTSNIPLGHPLYQIQEITLSTTAFAAITEVNAVFTATGSDSDVSCPTGCTLSGTFYVQVGSVWTGPFTWGTGTGMAAAIQTAIQAAGVANSINYAEFITVSATSDTTVFTNGFDFVFTVPARFAGIVTTASITVAVHTGSLVDAVSGTITFTTTTTTPGSVTDNLGDFFSTAVDGDLVLHFTDNNGGVWTTERIADIFSAGSATPATIATKIENALEGLPNFRIPSLTVTGNGQALSSATRSIAFQVTFDSERVSGNQNLLSCDPLPLGCQTAGCHPMYNQLSKDFTINSYGGLTSNAGYSTPLVAGSVFTALGAITMSTDSIFDNSQLAVDQAIVAVTFQYVGATVSSTEPLIYSASWTFSGTLPYAQTPSYITGDPTCSASNGPYCPWTYVPVGNSFTGSGVGYTHVPIGYGVYLELPNIATDNMLGLNGAAGTEATIVYQINAFRCAVTEIQAADSSYGSFECSGRGSCDRTTGTCTCFEGQYGDHCHLQTILV